MWSSVPSPWQVPAMPCHAALFVRTSPWLWLGLGYDGDGWLVVHGDRYVPDTVVLDLLRFICLRSDAAGVGSAAYAVVWCIYCQPCLS